MSHIPSRVLRALKGQNPDDTLIVDGHKTTLGEFVTDNWDDDYGPLEEIDDVLALREGQSTRIPGFVGGSTTVKRMERTASRMVVKPNPKEISRGEVVGDVHYTTVSRPQADGTIMVAIVLIPSGEVIFHDYVEDRSEVGVSIRAMLRDWNKMGFPSQMANRSRKRPGEKMSGRSASYWGDRVAAQDWTPSRKQAGFSDGSVKNWLAVMSALIIQDDRAQQKRDFKRGIPSNPYSLGLTLEGLEKVESDVSKYLHRDDEEALNALEASVLRRFTDVGFRRKFLKSLDKFRSDGKAPKYPIARNARSTELVDDDGFTLGSGRVAAQDWALNHKVFRRFFGSSVPDDWTEIPTPDDVRVAAWYTLTDEGWYALFILTPRDKKSNYEIYRSENDVFDAVDQKVQEYRAAQERAKARNEALRKSIQDLEANIGDILVSSWGYDQTNVDFYEVVATTGSMVTIREIAKKAVSDDGITAKVIPAPGRFVGPPMKKKIKPSYNGYSVKVRSFANAYVWGGKPVYETGAYAGH